MKKNSSKLGYILMSALLLFTCVTATTVALVNRINGFMLDDSGAIPLIPLSATATTEETTAPAPMTEAPSSDTEAATTETTRAPE